MNFKEMVELEESIDYPIYLETIDYDWCLMDGQVSWFNEEHYGVEFREGTHNQEDFCLVNGDNGCGETITYIFPLEKEMTEYDFYEKHEDA